MDIEEWFNTGKSNQLIDHCHTTGQMYYKHTKDRGWIKVWPLIIIVV